MWIELPPISASAPARLLVFLHPAGTTAEGFAPVAIAWQLRFPGATGIVLEGLRRFADGAAWFDAADVRANGPSRIDDASVEVAQRIARAQRETGIDGTRTVVVGVDQGATLALEVVRARPAAAAIVVGYATRLARPIHDGERIDATVHLIHGEFDSVVPEVHSRRAFRGLRAVGADVTLDIVEDEAHAIGQGLVNLGTTRVMQTLFRGRRPRTARSRLH